MTKAKQLGMEEEFKNWLQTKVDKPNNEILLYKPVKILKANTHRFRILRHLYNASTWDRNKAINYSYLEQYTPHMYNRYLHELRATGLVEKPRRGYYRITDKGIDITEKVENKGRWINPQRLETPAPKKLLFPPRAHPSSQPENIVQQDTYKMQILEKLETQGKVRTSEFYIDPQNLGLYLRRLEFAGIIERPARGIYRLTDKGRDVLREVRETGRWRA